MAAHPLVLGCHLSTAGGFRAMGKTALSLGATTFAFFTRNPRGGAAKAIDPDDAHGLRELMAAHGFGRLVAHAPYTMNLCSDKPGALDFARRALADDLARMELLPGNLYNLHPGSHMGQGADEGIRLVVEGLDGALVKGQSTKVLLETMAGKGSEIGRSFEELARIIDGVREDQLLGVCLDTCHVWDGGYDVRDGFDAVLDEFDRLIGLDRLSALHLNDSKHARGSRKDRHERIGRGEIGLGAFAAIVVDPRVRNLPMILETPNALSGYAEEISLLRGLADDRRDGSHPACGEVR